MSKPSETKSLQSTDSLIRISVRGLVEFLLRSGDIDNRHTAGAENAMQAGSRIHRKLQGRMGPEYEAEVPLQFLHVTDNYVLSIEGRADGIFIKDGEVTIDEIKGTYRKLERMKEPVREHLAQAMCYAYMYYMREFTDWEYPSIHVRLTYCNIETEELRYFFYEYTMEEITAWFQELLAEYRKWADFQWEWRERRQETIRAVDFPFPYREGQRELVGQVYHTISESKKLFIEAPTGVGKTISTVFPAVKAMGQGMGDKLFYLTAKTITRTVADDTLSLLREKGMSFKSVILTAKEKICFCEKAECNPDACPYAKGHMDRVNDALYAIITKEDNFTRETIERYAYEYRICPFEFGLDIALFSDGIICDYNYLFDPDARLKRFFSEGIKGDYLFLIDEAHNLLERGREMYSSYLVKEQVMELRRAIKRTVLSDTSKSLKNKDVEGQMTLNVTDGSVEYLPENTVEMTDAADEDMTQLPDAFQLTEEEEDSLYISSGKKGKRKARSLFVREGYAEKLIYQLQKLNEALLELKRDCPGQCVVDSIDDVVRRGERVHETISDYLSEREEHPVDCADELLQFFFDLSHFLRTAELLDENYVTYSMLCDDGSFVLKLFCMNPARNLQTCMDMGRSSILFSATFLPIQYYKKLLGGRETDYEVYAKSVFDPGKRALFIANDVTTKYTRRSEEEYERIARHIYGITGAREGNYMVFCPSYAFMHKVYDVYTDTYREETQECILQKESMNEEDRENFLNAFRSKDASTLIGFCVLGGIFGEGIDLKGEALIGAIVVGTGFPQVCFERELLKNHFDEEDGSGFDYAYRYPGMNKVLQAAGRVIRTEEDKGVIALLDERFLQSSYRRMFPMEWSNYRIGNVGDMVRFAVEFWLMGKV